MARRDDFPACEAVRLGAAVRRAWSSSPVTAYLDVDHPGVLGSWTGDEREWRAVPQRASRADAAEAGLRTEPGPERYRLGASCGNGSRT
ncbi:hypothetical protein [Actinomadura sp. WMMB 499]|uniref:hypothetical protein n=1 Tax=Actinomadura sp. WMMB 499 TaxID=1219491 RepID=UPI00159E4616|nr:hypothetical protein [Actinomadura sp. WMMB 499]